MNLSADTLRALREAMKGGVTVLTGAGLSAESGIATFRDMGGLWERYRLEDVASPDAWARDPALVNDFYNQRRAQLGTVVPNPGHTALAKLERHLGRSFWHITQNVDDLLERAGCQRVFHMHGELRKVRCVRCHSVSYWERDVDLEESRCSSCGATPLRPHIVWFGEVPFYLDDAIPEAIENSTLFISIGTSGVVYPAAGLVSAAKSNGAMTLEVNLEPSATTQAFDVHLAGRSGELLPQLVDALLGE